MSALLLSAGRSSFSGSLWGAYDVDLPLNIASCLAYLEQEGCPADVDDLQLVRDPVGHVASLPLERYQWVGISANLVNTSHAYDIAKAIRAKAPALPIVAFGIFNILGKRLLEECGALDAVVVGEEENTLLDIAKRASSTMPWSEITGMLYRAPSGELLKTPPRPQEENLDRFPLPARDRFKLSSYYPSPGKYKHLPQFTLLTSRGCYAACIFCSRLAGKGVRYRSAENVFAEIHDLYHRYNAKEIYFLDDIVTGDRTRMVKILDLMREHKIRVPLRVTSRVDDVDDELLRMLKDAGTYSMGYGMESGDDSILKLNMKDITTAQIEEAVRLTKKHGLEVRGFFMLNMAGDTIATTEKTLRFIDKLDLDLLNLQISYPWPGTALYHYVNKKCTWGPAKWDNWENCSGSAVTFTQNDLTPEYLEKTYRETLRKFYFRSRFMWNWAKRIQSFHDLKYSALQCAHLAHDVFLPATRATR